MESRRAQETALATGKSQWMVVVMVLKYTHRRRRSEKERGLENVTDGTSSSRHCREEFNGKRM